MGAQASRSRRLSPSLAVRVDRSTRRLGWSRLVEGQVQPEGSFGRYLPRLAHLRDVPFTLIQFGLHTADSLGRWERDFPQASVIGVDGRKRAREYSTKRSKVLIGKQGDPEFLQRLAMGNRPLVVVDDGTHRWRHQIDTFRALWPSVLPGGFYVIEGIHTSFGPANAEKYGTLDGQPMFSYLARIAEGAVSGSAAPSIQDEFDGYASATIDEVVLSENLVVITKRSHPQPWYRATRVADHAIQSWWQDLGPSYERIPAEAIGASGTVSEALSSLVESGPVVFEPAVTGILKNVLVHGSGPVVTADGGILAETLNCAQNIRRSSNLYRPFGDEHWVLERAVPETYYPLRADGRRYVSLKQTWDRNYGHWLIDALPKVGLVEDAAPLSECVFVTNIQTSAAMTQVVLDSLEMAGVVAEQVLFTELGALRFDELIVPGTITRHPFVKSPHAISFLEQLGEPVAATKCNRIYLSRNAYSRRRLTNEDAVLGILTDFGYEPVHTEQLSLREQIAAFKGADYVVGNLGAAFANLAFAPAGVSVLALTTEHMEHDFFYDIVCHKRGRYRALQGRASGPESLAADFVIDLDLLRECLSWLHGQG